MAYKSLTFNNDGKTLSISEILSTNVVSITAEENDTENAPYSAYLSFDLDFDDICTMIDWLEKAKNFLEECQNG